MTFLLRQVTLASSCAVGLLVVAPPSTAAADAPKCFGRTATIVGTAGDDALHGTSGSDVIVGLGGDDIIHAGGGRDYVCGGNGRDVIYGGDHGDHLSGGHQIDAIFGEAGRDWIAGGSRPDSLSDGPGNDRVYGGAGDDDFFPGTGNDVLDGGRSFPPSTPDAKHADLCDYLDYRNAPSGVAVDLAAGTATGGGAGDDTLRDIECAGGSPYDDQISGNAYDNRMYGDAGNDVLLGCGGDDRELRGGSGDDVVRGGAGDDRLTDQPLVNNYNNVDETGNDVFDGGAGDDQITVDGGNKIDGGPGTDWLTTENQTDSYAFSIDLRDGTMNVANEPGTVAGIENVTGGSAGGDVDVHGDDGSNVLSIFALTDYKAFVEGRGGDDTISLRQVGPGDATGTADGGDGNDTCQAPTTVNCERSTYPR